ncbi:MAG: DUF3306 domain-containing protein [Betaproteobacteria bacterium]
MTADDSNRPGFSLRRWSQKKREAARAAAAPDASSVAGSVAMPPTTTTPVGTSAPLAPTTPAAAASAMPPSATASAAPLPPVDTLSFESDFSAFLQPKVDESLKRLALKKLFADPRFNVMDGLDVYIDDYSKPDPLPPGMLEQLVQGRYLFDPPKTRVNAQGFVEDVPPDEVAAANAAGTPVETAAGDAARNGAATSTKPAAGDAARSGVESPADPAASTSAAELPAPAQPSLDIPSPDATQPVAVPASSSPSPRDPARK